MTYTIKHSDWQWLIEPSASGKKFVLKYKKPMKWRQCGIYRSAEAAASAVAEGRTGIPLWDAIKHDRPFPALSAWLIDPTGVALKAAASILRAAMPDLPEPPATATSGR
jgi:hypothetical protein